jgi:2-keto-4-pentenoate hydratase/2-oxohepta-3-ene-1,7-dioic acid hydratase in catechol pathway
MKIFCVGRNYSEHAKELKNDLPSSPVIFMKPDTALIKSGSVFYYPSFSKLIHFECELVIKIEKEGKNISTDFAKRYYSEIGLGIDFTARDLQNELKNKGLPWEISKGFNSSAVISDFLPINSLNNIQQIQFEFFQNNSLKQKGNSSEMIFGFDTVISYISQFYTLKKGDLIYTGTPAGVGEVQIGDKLEGFLEGKSILKCEIK